MMNASEKVDEAGFYAEPLPFKMAKIFVYAAILVFGTVGNSVVILTILKHKHMKKSPGNFFILNLAICDLLTPLISIPFDVLLVETNYKWPLGPTTCKVIPSLTTYLATSSPLTLAAIALDRHKTLLHPFKRRLDAKKAKVILALVHLSSCILVLPHFVTLEFLPNGSQCIEVWSHELLPKIYTFGLFLGQYALPLMFMSILYIATVYNLRASTERARSMSLNSKSSSGKRSVSGSRKNSISLNGANGPRADITHESLERHFRKESEHNAQVTKMFVVIVVVFAALTLPLEVLWLWRDFGGGDKNRYQPIIAVVCRLFTYANCCFNPVIFYKLSRDFHKGFLSFFSGSVPCCENAETLRQPRRGSTPGGFGSWDRIGLRIHTPSWMTPRGSFQSTHSTGLVDQGIILPNTTKLKKKLDVPLLEKNIQNKSSAVEVFTRFLANREEAVYQKKDKTNSLHGSSLKAEALSTNNVQYTKVTISVTCEDDAVINLYNLDSLEVMPQTDC
ncbi:neuropeptide Y receptor type 2-like [Montipora foliosa]|uniref:neuropeptide Y receptor type 2-like n=1 Tax=Montipora foliosa TaxID=591990 RepID=UPI0035F10517